MAHISDIEYHEFVAARFKKFNKGKPGLLHAAVGICGEAGELIDAIKKHWVYGQDLDENNVIEELGDIEFYLQAMRDLMLVTRMEVLAANVEKLKKRYPNVYTDDLAAKRMDKHQQMVSQDLRVHIGACDI